MVLRSLWTGQAKLIRLMMLPLLMKMGILCFSGFFHFFFSPSSLFLFGRILFFPLLSFFFLLFFLFFLRTIKRTRLAGSKIARCSERGKILDGYKRRWEKKFHRVFSRTSFPDEDLKEEKEEEEEEGGEKK